VPRTVRPFSNRAVPDEAGNVTPTYDAPSGAELYERTGDGQGPAAPARLVGSVNIELLPFELGAVHTIVSEDPPYRAPEMLIGEDTRRGALTLYSIGPTIDTRWRVGRSAADVLRDDSSILIGTVAGGVAAPPSLRVSWRQPVWIMQRDGTAGAHLIVLSEGWAR
jgi:hypothetical protein